ncbi:MAG TPA: hypothetical protein VKT82_31030 [Ktedonobacterales bacterium]|nr:hypothetical protein [Ktedonobacterales bacterium]
MEQSTKPKLPRWTITVSPALIDEFRGLASEHKRSLNSELVWALEQYAKAERRKGKKDADAQSV